VLPDRLARVMSLFARLPGVGDKTAQRFALYLATDKGGLAADLGRELSHLVEELRSCDHCGNIATIGPDGRALCPICTDPRRDPSLLCVVYRVQDLLAIERSGSMRGRYFVLGRLLSPLDGIGPEALPVPHLLERVQTDEVREVILATPPSVEGEATALFLGRELAVASITITRIASGVPHGGDLEFADQITLGRAIMGRRSLADRS
jgi:recombination protein RecR